MGTNAVETTMVGRADALERLRGAFEAGRRGEPRAVVIAGEAGIGKTRLLQEFLRELSDDAAEPRVVVASGQCVDLGPIGAPFTPIRRVLRELYEAVGDGAFRAAAQSPAVISTLASLLPELDSSLPDRVGVADYIAEAVERLLERLSAEHHLVLVIEDVHWADSATLALLSTLALTLRGTHLTIVMTYRSDDVGRGHPLRPVLAELERSRIVTSLELPRLSAEEIAEHIRHLTGDTADGAMIDRIAERSGGIPFFVEELVGLGDDALPDTLRGLILARVDRLDPTARRVVETLCAGGVHVSDEVLARVWTGDADARATGARTAIAAGILTADDDGFTFRHALIREALHDELLPGERIALHRAYALDLQERIDEGEPGLAATAAEHWLAARDDARTFRATADALGEARAAFAIATVAPLGERLLELWDQVPTPERVVGTRYGRLAVDTINLLEDLGASARGLRVAEVALARELPAIDRAELLLVSVRGLSPIAGGWETSRDRMEDALDIVDEDASREAGSVRVRALSLLAQNPHATDPVGLLDRAMDIAETADDPDLIATVLRARGVALYGRVPEGSLLADLQRAATLAIDPVRHYSTMNSLAAAYFHLRRYEECIDVALTAYDECVLLGLERGVGAFLLANAAEAQLATGRYDAGMATGRRAIELRPAQGFHSFAVRTLARAAIWNDRVEDADAAVARMDDTVWMPDDPDETAGWAVYRTERLLLQAETESGGRRAALIDEAIGAIVPVFGAVTQNSAGVREEALPTVAWTLRMAADSGMDAAALAVPFAQDAAASAERGDNLTVRALIAAEAACTGSVDAVTGWEQACLVTAADTATRGQRHYARFRLGQALQSQGCEDEAAAAFALVAKQAPADGHALLARWALAGAPRPLRPSASRRRDTTAPTLTSRETEVLGLVAEGLTNPQIGARLFISPKTASVHVSAILAKIGAANRAEAAAWFAAKQAGS
ncbi:hypothetical protein ASD65_16345 [Microbacterium sp. Root61]|uniref:ATP-binding protein n=1 Tax=Microbacterium sp. Root61 TaxID=1736570 RepID=UPI0006FBE246|nr:LuxR family transcriptional regulator [Microbacterium sp. Root61]KRA22095.1 hypothetical protein ASD65_16345 [Microbacterium sp. Root61]